MVQNQPLASHVRISVLYIVRVRVDQQNFLPRAQRHPEIEKFSQLDRHTDYSQGWETWSTRDRSGKNH